MTARQATPVPVITGMGHYFPPTKLTNQFYEGLDIGSSAAWIEERVGIIERRTVLALDDVTKLRRGETTLTTLRQEGRIMPIGEMCREPWRMAKERSAQAYYDPNVVISGTSVPDWDIPANACAIAATLGLETTAFDVNSACSSFVVDLHVARGLLLSGQATDIAIFNAERYSTRVNFADRASCVLFGDGAAASIVSTRPGARGLAVRDTVVISSPAGSQHVKLPDGDFFSQNGAAVQKFAVTKTVAVTQEIMKRQNLQPDDISYFVAHQANYRMLMAAVEKLGFHHDKHLCNVQHHGNQGGAGAPNVLSMNWDKYKVGDLIAVAVVGSGLTWAGALLEVV
ncbi:MAG: ketoacyl-ACP synthase III [Deltaproteobacteria bacterium]|nr:ketoacyl-ACP synthase III [Deltaproteobacteria bacterium]